MNLNWFSIYAFAFFGTTLSALFFTFIIRFVSRRIDFMDRPKSEHHKQQTAAVALGGGAALMATFLFSIAAATIIFHFRLADNVGFEIEKFVNPDFAEAKYTLLLLAAIAAGMLGLIDDITPMKALPKFVGQFIIAAVAVIWGGARISLFIPYPAVTCVVSILWFMFIMNAVNFFDNMDALAAGSIAIAMFFFTLAAAFNSQYLVATIAASTMGLCVGFLIFNRPPATIYLGDSGSHFLGFLTALISVSVTYFRTDSNSFFPVAVPLLILAPIIIDAITVCVVRTVNAKPFWIGDTNHISHRFVKMGLSRPQAVLCVHMLCAVFGLGALALLWGDFMTTAVITLQGLLLAGFMLFIQYKSARS